GWAGGGGGGGGGGGAEWGRGRVRACSVLRPPSPSPAYGAIVLRDRVGFSPTMPQHEAGARVEPNPSEACAMGRMRAPTEAAAPPLEPPEIRVVSHGFFVAPETAGSQVREMPRSDECLGAKLTRPAGVRRSTCSRSAAASGASAKKREPRVSLTRARQPPRSFSRNGTPRNGPSGRPSAMAFRR